MKITDVKVETIRIPMKKPFRIAFAVQDHSLNVLVKISTDEGLWGIGEAAPFEPVTGESAATVLEALKLFRTGLIGMDPLDIEHPQDDGPPAVRQHLGKGRGGYCPVRYQGQTDGSASVQGAGWQREPDRH